MSKHHLGVYGAAHARAVRLLSVAQKNGLTPVRNAQGMIVGFSSKHADTKPTACVRERRNGKARRAIVEIAT